MMVLQFLFLVCCISSVPTVAAFTPVNATAQRSTPGGERMGAVPAHLIDPTERDAHYGHNGDRPLNVAQYLVDLHDAKAALDFCGGMMFQLVLSDKLRDHLVTVAAAKGEGRQPVIYDASRARMFQIPDYSKAAAADNVHFFHGREIRQVPGATGGMGFVFQMSLADGQDPQGWTAQEVEGYDGWGHDIGRTWRNGDVLEGEGFEGFRSEFGPKSFALHHRCYLHLDGSNRMWMSAEDGCEGTPARPSVFSPLTQLLG